MKDMDYVTDHHEVLLKLNKLRDMRYGPSHSIDTLKECIKILQPYAEKEKEKTHA